MSTSLEKGNRLESAVRGIETAILKSNPALSEGTFVIEAKKIFVVNGVRHEVDVYVVVDLQHGYKAIFIFECKNWIDAVGKNEIIVFSEKIRALQAQKGFFVAKSFSKDAVAQAKVDPRIELLIATEHNAAETPAPFDFHTIFRDLKKSSSTVEFVERGASGLKPPLPVDPNSASVVFMGNSVVLNVLVQQWISESTDANSNQFPSGTLPQGTYDRVAQFEKEFAANDLIVDGMDIQTIKIRTEFPIQVLRPPVVSHFEVSTRGRTISFAPVQLDGATLQTDIIFRS